MQILAVQRVKHIKPYTASTVQENHQPYLNNSNDEGANLHCGILVVPV